MIKTDLKECFIVSLLKEVQYKRMKRRYLKKYTSVDWKICSILDPLFRKSIKKLKRFMDASKRQTLRMRRFDPPE